MRAALIAMLLATASSHALAEWISNGRMIGQDSVDYTAAVTLNCAGVLAFYRNSPAKGMRWRIDKHAVWNDVSPEIEPTAIETGTGFPMYAHRFSITPQLLKELTHGADLRVHWGDTDYDRFSLVGFTRAFDQLECTKKTDQEYFL